MDLREKLSSTLREEVSKLALQNTKKPRLSLFFAGIRCREMDLSSVFAYLEYVDAEDKPCLTGFEVERYLTTVSGLQEFEALAEELGAQVHSWEENDYVGRSFRLPT